MISRLGACKGFVLVFWGWGLLHWFSGWLALVKIHLWGSGSSLHCGCCDAHWSLSVLMGGVKWHCPTLSSLEQGVCTCYSSESPHRRANFLPFFVPSFHQISAFTPSASVLPVCRVAQYSYVLSQKCGWVSKFQILRSWRYADPCWPSAQGSHHAAAGAGLSQKSSHTITWGLGVYGKVQQKASTKVCCPWQVSLFLC